MTAAPEREPVSAFVGLGANLGDAAQAVQRAIDEIAVLPHTSMTRRSSLYRSAPVDSSGPDYVNAVIELRTALSAPELLAGLQRIERDAGRQRPWRNAPRTLDLDLLLYGDARIESEHLSVPHPRMDQRAFVLVPLAEIAPARVSGAALAALTSQVIARIDAPADDRACYKKIP